MSGIGGIPAIHGREDVNGMSSTHDPDPPATGAGPLTHAARIAWQRARSFNFLLPGAATRAGAGTKNDGCPLCLFQASQIRNSEAENTTQRMLRRMSVMRRRRRRHRMRKGERVPLDDPAAP